MHWRSFYDRPLFDEIARYVRTGGASFKRKGLGGLWNAGKYLIERESRPPVVGASPVSTQIEPTKICNMKCVMCSNPFMPAEKKGHMPLDRFVELLDQMPYLSYLLLQGLGEIFCHPRIMDFFQEVCRRSIYYGFSTNGLLLDAEKASELLKMRLGWINFSIDTHEPARYAEIRGVNVLDKVLSNVYEFVRLSKAAPYPPRVEVRAVYLPENIDDMPRMLELVHELGIRNLTAKEATSRSIVPGCKSRAAFYGAEQQRVHAMKRKLSETARRLGMRLTWQSFSDFDPLTCYLPWASCYITYDGYVTPCSNLEDPDAFNFGNVFTKRFEEIWNSPEYREFRIHFLDVRKNRACIHHQECWNALRRGSARRSSSGSD